MSRAEDGFLKALTRRLEPETPAALLQGKSAGVAVIFRDAVEAEEVLLIRRAQRDGDPWSGHVAFPGGMVGAKDGSFRETARREAWEEVGIDLSSKGGFLGYMHEVEARTRAVVVVPSVFKLRGTAAVTPNNEVASYHWVPLIALARRDARSTYVPRGGGGRSFPSLVRGGLVIWGLTERILSEIIGESSG